MEMDFIERLVVHGGFSAGNAVENGAGRLLHRVVQAASVDNCFYLGKITMFSVMRMCMGMDVIVCWGVMEVFFMMMIQFDIHPDAGNPVLHARSETQGKLLTQSQAGEFRLQKSAVDSQADHGRQVHVAAYTGTAIIIEYLHGVEKKEPVLIFKIRKQAVSFNHPYGSGIHRSCMETLPRCANTAASNNYQHNI